MEGSRKSGKSQTALIKIIGIQAFVDQENEPEDRIELVTLGTYHPRPDGGYLVYKESELTGMAGVTTVLRVQGERVTLNRMGAAELKQEFEAGVRHRSVYHTNFGSLWLSVLTKRIETDLTAQGGRISLEYDLFVDNELVSHNGLAIMIKEEPR